MDNINIKIIAYLKEIVNKYAKITYRYGHFCIYYDTIAGSKGGTMNLENLQAIVQAFRKARMIRCTYRAFKVDRGSSMISIGYCVYYKDATAKCYAISLAKELSLKPALEQVKWNLVNDEQGAHTERVKAAHILREQIKIAKTLIGRKAKAGD